MPDQWENYLETITIPDEPAAIVRSLSETQLELLEGFVNFVIDLTYDAFAMNFDTDASSFVPMLPEADRRNMVDVSDDVESAIREAIRTARKEVAG